MAKILLVDDVEGIRISLHQVLEGMGHDVCECSDVETAIGHLAKCCYDAVITDLLMPDRDGYELVDYLSEEKPETKILVMSGGSSAVSTGLAIDSLRSEVNAVLVKPFSRKDFMDVVKGVIH